MKTVEYYSKLNYKTSVYRDDEGDFITEVDDLPGCVAHGATPDEAFKNLEEAKHAWVESRLAAGLDVPEPRPIEDYSGKVLLRMPRSLHRRLAVQSTQERVSLNQYIVSLLSYSSSGNRAFTPEAQAVQGADKATSVGKVDVAEKVLDLLRTVASKHLVDVTLSQSCYRQASSLASQYIVVEDFAPLVIGQTSCPGKGSVAAWQSFILDKTPSPERHTVWPLAPRPECSLARTDKVAENQSRFKSTEESEKPDEPQMPKV
jgi:predicted RNase H-like HicB family nuclease